MVTKKRLFIISLLVLLSISALCALGTWQLKRLNYKNELIANIEKNLSSPSIELSHISNNIGLYSKNKLIGSFEQNKYIFLYGRRSGNEEKDGYYLLSPFNLEKGERILVLRGWVPSAKKAEVENFKAPSKEVITGIAMPGEKKQFFVPKNDIKRSIWFTLDLNEAAKTLITTPVNVYFLQLEAEHLPNWVKPLHSNNLSKIRNDHLEYAITWFSLALGLLIIYLIFLRKSIMLNQ